MKIFSIIIFLCCNLFADLVSAQGDEKSTALSNIGIGLKHIQRLNQKSDGCEVLTATDEPGGPGLKHKMCESDIDKLKKELVFVLEYDNYNQIPKIVADKLPPENEPSRWNKKYVLILTANEMGISSVGRLNTGDDKGFTVGSKVEVGATYENKLDVKVSLTGNLYTYELPRTRRQIDSSTPPTAAQLFRNETILEVLASSQRAGKLSYWSAKAGLVNVGPTEKMGLLDGSWQQREFHKFLNKQGIQNTNYTYVDDKKGDKYGAYIGATVGLQQAMRLSKNCVITGRVAVGGNLSNLPEHLYVEASAGLEARYNLRSGSVLAGVEATKITHLQGSLTNTTFKLAYEKKNYEVGISVTKHDGQLLNGWRGYNIPNLQTGLNDSTISAYIKIYNK